MVGADEELPEDQKPVLQDDGLTEADPEDALQDVDFEYDEEDHKTCPDYDPEQDATQCPDFDPEQDATQGIQQRLMVRAGHSKGSTILLRNIKIDGKQPEFSVLLISGLMLTCPAQAKGTDLPL